MSWSWVSRRRSACQGSELPRQPAAFGFVVAVTPQCPSNPRPVSPRQIMKPPTIFAVRKPTSRLESDIPRASTEHRVNHALQRLSAKLEGCNPGRGRPAEILAEHGVREVVHRAGSAIWADAGLTHEFKQAAGTAQIAHELLETALRRGYPQSAVCPASMLEPNATFSAWTVMATRTTGWPRCYGC